MPERLSDDQLGDPDDADALLDLIPAAVDEIDRLREHGCPHVVTDGLMTREAERYDLFCGPRPELDDLLSVAGTDNTILVTRNDEPYVVVVDADRFEESQRRLADLTGLVRDLADSVSGRCLLKSEADLAAHALRAGCDRAEGKG